MAKILSLRLNYKGKFLDYAKQGKEIRKQFYIGSNKHLQWQILDSSFPDKHLFVKKVGGSLVMNIPSGAALECEKDGKPIDSNYLKQNNLLSNNQLHLDPSIKGNLSLNKDWNVDFDFRTPWIPVLTEEQRRIVAACAKRPTLSAVDRFNRNFLLVATVLAVIFMLVFDIFLKPESMKELSIEDRIQHLRHEEAQRVTPELDTSSPRFAQQDAVEDDGGDAQTTTATGTQTGGGKASTGAKGLSGIVGSGGAAGGSASGTGSGSGLMIATTVGGFSITSGSGGGSGSGSGPGGGGGGASGGFSSNLGGPGFDTTVGSIANVAPGTQGQLIRPPGATGGTYITGDASKLAMSGQPIGQTQADIAVIQDYVKQGIQTITEASIAQMDVAAQAKHQNLKNQVNSYAGQLQTAYRQASLSIPMTFRITLYINANGSVRYAEVVPMGSNYPESFVSNVRNICEGWRFTVSEAVSYQFRTVLKP